MSDDITTAHLLSFLDIPDQNIFQPWDEGDVALVERVGCAGADEAKDLGWSMAEVAGPRLD